MTASVPHGVSVSGADPVGPASFHASMTRFDALPAEHAEVPVPSANFSPRRGQRYPAGRQHPQQVAMGEEEHVAVDGRLEASRDDSVGASPDLLSRLAARPRTGPDRPARILGADLGGRSALMGAVVPLGQVVVDEAVREPGDPSGLRGTRSRAREYDANRCPARRGPRIAPDRDRPRSTARRSGPCGGRSWTIRSRRGE